VWFSCSVAFDGYLAHLEQVLWRLAKWLLKRRSRNIIKRKFYEWRGRGNVMRLEQKEHASNLTT
jgi:hypothetical protein